MIYKVRLNDKTYEVDVAEGEAVILSINQESGRQASPLTAPIAAPPPAAAAPAPAPVAATPPPAAAPAPLAATPLATVRTMQSGANVIKSPFPGIVIALKVSVGDNVKAGQVVAVIEAMKMENEIVAAKSGKVNHIHVVKGAQVSTGSPLIDFI